jgi:hypothetical protein
MRATVAVSVAVVGALALAACSGGSKPRVAPAAASSSAASTTASSSPVPSPSTSAPLSPFETQAPVIALRNWAAAATKAYNASQNYSDPSLVALEEPSFVSVTSTLYADDAKSGLTYPGPLPFTPIAVASPSPTEASISTCVVGQGFAVSPATQKPIAALTVLPVTFSETLTNGAWLLSGIANATTYSCTNVVPAEQAW